MLYSTCTTFCTARFTLLIMAFSDFLHCKFVELGDKAVSNLDLIGILAYLCNN